LSTDPKSSARGLEAWLFYLGAAALLFAMAADAIAVLGRHLGMPLLGSIELVQAAMLVASSAAIVSATMAGKHAVVHLVIDRLSPAARATMQRIHSALCATFFLALAAGSIWIALDLRGSYEQSELLQIPYAPLRIISIASVLAVALVYLKRAGKGFLRP
jgi:TRAP-type C4-dicarboxylate transport system permease small subunit